MSSAAKRALALLMAAEVCWSAKAGWKLCMAPAAETPEEEEGRGASAKVPKAASWGLASQDA